MRLAKIGLWFLFVMSLAACVRQAPPQEDVNTQALPVLIASTTPNDGAVGVTPLDGSTLNFTGAMNKASVERSVSVFTGKYSPTTNPTTFTKLQLTSMCNGKWRVRNPNAFPLSFIWDVYNGTEKGMGVAMASGDTFFYSSKGSNTVRVFVGNQQQQVKATNPSNCTDTPFTFVWTPDSRSVMITPSQPFTENSDVTIALSTLAKNIANIRLPNPYSYSFSTILPSLPEPWQSANINLTATQGTTASTIKGYATSSSTEPTFTLKSITTAGTAIPAKDPFHFVYQPQDKDATLTARMQLLQPSSPTAK
jgi:hypothetical protein